MKTILDEWDNPDSLSPHVFRIQLDAETKDEAAALTRMALLYKREPPVVSVHIGQNGSFQCLVWIAKNHLASGWIAPYSLGKAKRREKANG